MAGSLESSSTWRLSTPGGIKYKNLGMAGSFDRESGSVTWKVIVLDSDLYSFMEEIFPFQETIGYVAVPIYFKLSALPGFGAKSARFSPYPESLPGDPFDHDASAAAGTYAPTSMVEVLFEPIKGGEDETNPIGFLEVSAEASIEVLSIGAGGAKMSGTEGGTEEDVTDPSIAQIVPIPQVMWTIRWQNLDVSYFETTVAARLRSIAGKVNSAAFSLLYNAPRGTVLFAGFGYTIKNTWRTTIGGEVEAQPMTLEMKFVEKNIILDDGRTIGHNHHYIPGEGWKYLTRDSSPVYEYGDFDSVFSLVATA